MNKAILHLNLQRKWFDMILSGEKREEYRKISPYWDRIFKLSYPRIKGKYYLPSDVKICFSNGYKKDRDQFCAQLIGVHIGYGLEKWGAIPGERYYILSLGDITDVMLWSLIKRSKPCKRY